MFTTTRLDVCLSGEAGSSAIELHTRLAHARMGCEGSGHRSRQLTHVPPHSSHLVGFGQYSCRCAAETYATRGHQNHDEYLWRCLKYGVFRFFFPGYAESLAGRDVLTSVFSWCRLNVLSLLCRPLRGYSLQECSTLLNCTKQEAVKGQALAMRRLVLAESGRPTPIRTRQGEDSGRSFFGTDARGVTSI